MAESASVPIRVYLNELGKSVFQETAGDAPSPSNTLDLRFEAVSDKEESKDASPVAGIIIDGVGMPDDGIGLVRELRSEQSSVTIILIVEEAEQELLARAFEREVDEIVPISLLRNNFEGFAERIQDTVEPIETHSSFEESDSGDSQFQETEYKQLFDSVSDGLVVHDPETGEMLAVNDRYSEITGYSESELVGANIGLIVPEDPEYTREKALARINAVQEEGPQLFEFKGQCKDGSTFIGEIHLNEIEIRDQARILASVRDITARKNREQDFEQIFNEVNDIISVYDPETGDLTRVNNTMSEVTGYERETILENGIGLISASEAAYSAEKAARIIKNVAETGESRELEWGLETAAGEFRFVDVHATPATIRGEKRVLTISRDITERKRSKRRLEAILDRIDEAIFLTKAHEITKPSKSPEYVSAGYESIWGESLESIRNRYNAGFFGTLHPEDKPDYEAYVKTIIEDIERGSSNRKYTKTYRIQTPEKRTKWVESEFYPVEWDIGPPRIIISSRDVTDRKERERRLTSFENATDDLTTADSPDEAVTAAGTAAEKTLDLPAVGIFLYDQADGSLRSKYASTPHQPELASLSVKSGAGLAWQAFSTGSIIGPETTDSEEPIFGAEISAVDRDGLADWRLIPLTNHGCLFLASVEGAISTDILQSAHVLTATLEAALNHIKGQKRLASTEAKLRSKRDRVKRLDRIVKLTRQVESAITKASGSTEIEREVCERLVETGPYEFAWIGELEPGTDRFTPRTVAGESKHFVKKTSQNAVTESAVVHPAIRSWKQETVSVKNNLVNAEPTSKWKTNLLEQGYQSICAIPLAYNNITYGVLTVGSESPNSFDDRTREVLGQLGHSIGHALASIDRRQALETDETIEVEFCAPHSSLRLSRIAQATGVPVRHTRTVSREDGTVRLYLAFEAECEDPVEVVESVYSGMATVIRDDGQSVLVEIETETWFGSFIADYGGVLVTAEATPDSTTIVVELPTQTDLRAFSEHLQEEAPTLELQAKRQQKRAESGKIRSEIHDHLTERQVEVLRRAVDEGYFEWPRESDGSEVAETLDITQPTLNKHLRLAEKKAFETLFST